MFKATFGSIPGQNLVAVVVLPFQVPDNICHYACQEVVMCIEQLSPNSKCSLKDLCNPNYESPHEQLTAWERLDAYLSSVIYQVQTMAFSFDFACPKTPFQCFMSSPLSNTAIQMPSILHLNTTSIPDLERPTKSTLHCVKNYDH